MTLFGHIRPLYFFAAFAVGLLFCYVMAPAPKIVVKFPTPYNVHETVYVDKAENCYKYSAEKVACPIDKSIIRDGTPTPADT